MSDDAILLLSTIAGLAVFVVWTLLIEARQGRISPDHYLDDPAKDDE